MSDVATYPEASVVSAERYDDLTAASANVRVDQHWVCVSAIGEALRLTIGKSRAGCKVFGGGAHTYLLGELLSQSEDEHSEFLAATYQFSKVGQQREAVDWIIDYVDGLLNESKLAECNKVLRLADPEQMADSLIVTFLGITLAAKQRLGVSRDRFYKRAFSVVAQRRGEVGARRLLDKYR